MRRLRASPALPHYSAALSLCHYRYYFSFFSFFPPYNSFSLSRPAPSRAAPRAGGSMRSRGGGPFAAERRAGAGRAAASSGPTATASASAAGGGPARARGGRA